MNKSTKGVLAASVGVAMLAGGAGTLAYWNSGVTASGNAINSGHLELQANPGCGDWILDSGEAVAGKIFDPAVDKVVPGDVLSRDCTYDVIASGEHLRATVAISTPTFSYTSANDYGSAIHADLANVTVDGAAFNVATDSLTEASKTLVATETVTFDYGTSADNTSQDVAAALSDVTITATQVHN